MKNVKVNMQKSNIIAKKKVEKIFVIFPLQKQEFFHFCFSENYIVFSVNSPKLSIHPTKSPPEVAYQLLIFLEEKSSEMFILTMTS